MAKFLRYFAPTCADDRDFVRDFAADSFSLNMPFDLFEYRVKRIPSNGITKLVVSYTRNPKQHLQQQLLDVLVVDFFVDLPAWRALTALEQKKFILDSIVTTLNATQNYGWKPSDYEPVYGAIVDDGIVFADYWKKPVRSPNRQLTAQLRFEYERQIDIWLVVRNREGETLHEALLCRTAATMGALQHVHGRIVWADDGRVQVRESNDRDYWEYDLDSRALQFHYPRAEAGDPHGQYQLGLMYYHGQYLLQDRQRGLELIRSAAASGNPHAIKFLERGAS